MKYGLIKVTKSIMVQRYIGRTSYFYLENATENILRYLPQLAFNDFINSGTIKNIAVVELKKYIQKLNHNIIFLLNQMMVSLKTISKPLTLYFKSYLDLSVTTERIILESKGLLDFSDKNINEIAEILGFDEIFIFQNSSRPKSG
jgi:hypothetical protein